MQYVTRELKKLIRKEAEIDLKAQSPDGMPPTLAQIEERFRELLKEEYVLLGQTIPQSLTKFLSMEKGRNHE